MAKQIYIDENGNPIEVSGTINNASMLPISANDSTDTKTYIDTGLSGLIKTTTASGTTTSSGALALPTGVNAEKVIACVGTNGTLHRYAFPRGETDGYLQVFKIDNNTMVACPSESVNFTVIYY